MKPFKSKQTTIKTNFLNNFYKLQLLKMEHQQTLDQFLSEINRIRIRILNKFSEIKTVLFERERSLLKELDIIQNTFEVQLNLYKKQVQICKDLVPNLAELRTNEIYLPQLIQERQTAESLKPLKKIQFRLTPNITSIIDRIGSIKVTDENPNTRRKPTYGEERESQLFKLTRKRSKDDLDLTQIRKPFSLEIKNTLSAPQLQMIGREFRRGDYHPLKKNKIVSSKLSQITFPSKHSSPSAL